MSDLLATLGLQTGTVTPADLAARLPFARVTRTGGDDDLVTDTARVVVDHFATSRALAVLDAAKVRDLLLDGPHVVSSGGRLVVLDDARTDSAPVSTPWSDTAVRRVTAAYRIRARRAASPV